VSRSANTNVLTALPTNTSRFNVISFLNILTLVHNSSKLFTTFVQPGQNGEIQSSSCSLKSHSGMSNSSIKYSLRRRRSDLLVIRSGADEGNASLQKTQIAGGAGGALHFLAGGVTRILNVVVGVLPFGGFILKISALSPPGRDLNKKERQA
jgi:hypothetical protein